ncbi:MAG TPA: hypothetical protein VF228_22755 [Iamia sp.]
MAAGLVGLALLAGTTGCSKIGEKVAEEAIEQNSNCEGVDVDVEEGGFSGTCGDEQIDANVSGEGELPDGYPADVAPPEGYEIITAVGSTDPIQSYDVYGTIAGDVAGIYEDVKATFTAAGYTIDVDSLAEGPTGPVGNFSATGPDFTAAVTVSEVATDAGEVSVNYVLNAAG